MTVFEKSDRLGGRPRGNNGFFSAWYGQFDWRRRQGAHSTTGRASRKCRRPSSKRPGRHGCHWNQAWPGGCHLREADIFFEIVDIETGKPVMDGEYGEIVFTSLSARGTPLIRYRTGDISRFITEPCTCGTVLKTMDIVKGRKQGRIKLDETNIVEMRDFDEALFPIEGLFDFQVTITREIGMQCLDIGVSLAPDARGDILEEIDAALDCILPVRKASYNGKVLTKVRIVQGGFKRGTTKRIILDRRDI